MALTFTDKTAQGMKSRIYDRLKDMGRDDLRSRIGDLYVGTIHGYCYRLLTDYFNYGNHDIFDENQERAFLSIVGKDLGLAESGNYIRNCKNFLETVKVVEGELIPDETLRENKKLIGKIFASADMQNVYISLNLINNCFIDVSIIQ